MAAARFRGPNAARSFPAENDDELLADDVDPLVRSCPCSSTKRWKQLVLDAEDANRLRMVDEPRRGDVAGQVDADQ